MIADLKVTAYVILLEAAQFPPFPISAFTYMCFFDHILAKRVGCQTFYVLSF